MSSKFKQKTLSGLFWKFAEKFSAHMVTFIVSVILARILDKEAYSAIALITVFITISNVFIDSGLSTAIVQKKDADDLDYSTVFYFNLLFSIVLYLIIFFIVSPLVASFYDMHELCSALRVLGISVIVYGLKGVQQAYVSKHMIFKKFFFATLGGTVFSGLIGILMAYFGFGVMSIVAQHLSNVCIDTLVLWISVKWRPKKCFSYDRLKKLYTFGWRILASSLIDTLYNNVRQLIIGKMYPEENALADYNKGKSFPVLVVDNINTAIDSVLLPSMSTVQNNIQMLKYLTRRSIKMSSYIMCPMMIGLIACAKPLVLLLLTEKWEGCIVYLQIFSITYMLRPIHTANLNAIKALGRSDIFLKLEIIKKIVGIIILGVTMWFGPLVMAFSMMFATSLNSFINAFPNKKLLNYSYIEQVKDFLPNFLISALMGAIVYFVTFLRFSNIATLFVQVILGVTLYLIFSIVFKVDSFNYLFDTVMEKFPQTEKIIMKYKK